MKFEVLQKALQKPLQLIAGVVERQGTLPVLSNLLLEVDNEGYLTLTATDQEVEFSDCIKVDQPVPGETTVPARKLVDICRNLPAGETTAQHSKILDYQSVVAGFAPTSLHYRR